MDDTGLPSGLAPAPDEGLRERKKRETRHTLHRAATALVTQHGLSGVTTDDIARAAGVSPRTFFNYFPTKEAALVGVPEVIVEKIAALVAERPADEPLWTTARLVADTLCRVATRDEELWHDRSRMLANRPEVGPLVAGSERAMELGLVESIVARAEAQPEVRSKWVAPMMALAAINAVRVASQVGDEPDEVRRILAEILDQLDAVYA